MKKFTVAAQAKYYDWGDNYECSKQFRWFISNFTMPQNNDLLLFGSKVHKISYWVVIEVHLLCEKNTKINGIPNK